MDALIGHSGFVGTTLLRQRSFDRVYRSSDIHDIRGKSFDLVVCAGAPAQKWIANKDPEQDRARLQALIEPLQDVKCRQFVLISTVDVFKVPAGVTEQTPVDEEGLHAYGANRRMLEKFVIANFAGALIVRLPGLVGPGLRKNVIYDFLNGNNVDAIDSRAVFQFYPMVNLWHDIECALHQRLALLHLTAEPISVGDLAQQGFGLAFSNHKAASPASYDMRSIHAAKFWGRSDYQYSRMCTIQAVRHYRQTEARYSKADAGT